MNPTVPQYQHLRNKQSVTISTPITNELQAMDKLKSELAFRLYCHYQIRKDM